MSSRAPSTRPPSRPGTRASTSDAADSWVVAILEGKGIAREVGVVAMDCSIGKVIVTQFSDTPAYVKTQHLLATRPPSLLLVPATSLAAPAKNGGEKGEASVLIRTLQDSCEGVPLIGVLRKFWNEQAGYEFINQLIIHDEDRVGTVTNIKAKYFCLSAAAALFKYLDHNHNLSFPPKSLHIKFCALEGNCLIDVDTAKNLELVVNVRSVSFTDVELRTNILSPLTQVTVIDSRLDAVEELIGVEERFHAVRKALEPFVPLPSPSPSLPPSPSSPLPPLHRLKRIDIDALIGQFVSTHPRLLNSTTDPAKEAESKTTKILQLRTILHCIPPLRLALQNSDSTLLKRILNILEDERVEVMLEEIGKTINEDAVVSLQKSSLTARTARLYAIKAERKLLLDVARETFKENLNDAFVLADEMKIKYGLEISLNYGPAGCTFSVPTADLEGKQLPKIFTNVNKKGRKTEFTSLDLKKRNARLAESVVEIFIMSDEILDEVFAEVRNNIACLYHCSEAIAMLDMLASFADVASKNKCVRPEFTDTLAIKSGRHPLHECFRLSDGSFVPNDTYASDTASFQIVTGANGSGKSTLIRQIAILHIMAQIGSYVPAEYASFKVVSAILSRLSNDDSIESNLSTFASEMTTMSLIQSTMHSCKPALIIIDELGRGTSPSEGVGIAHALAESIIEAKATCFFATHFKELCTTLGHFPNVVTIHLDAEIDTTQPDFSLTFHHRVLDGTSPLTHYGLELAKNFKLPADVLERATEVSLAIETLATEGVENAKSTELAARRRGLLQIKTDLRDLYKSKGSTAEVMLALLRRLQNDAVEMLSATLEGVGVDGDGGGDAGREAAGGEDAGGADVGGMEEEGVEEEYARDGGEERGGGESPVPNGGGATDGIVGEVSMNQGEEERKVEEFGELAELDLASKKEEEPLGGGRMLLYRREEDADEEMLSF